MDSLEQQEIVARRRLEEALSLSKEAVSLATEAIEILENLKKAPLIYSYDASLPLTPADLEAEKLKDQEAFEKNMAVIGKISQAFGSLLDAAGILCPESCGDTPGKRSFTARGYHLQTQFRPSTKGSGDSI